MQLHPKGRELRASQLAFEAQRVVFPGTEQRRRSERLGYRDDGTIPAGVVHNHLLLRVESYAERAVQGSRPHRLTRPEGTRSVYRKNILTFNPGWDNNAQKLATFTDVRELQRQLRAQGVPLQQEADESTTGPASFVAVDPDGNPILVDQHV